MTTDRPTALRLTRHFAATPERVFDAWLDPATAGRWLFSTPAGEMVRVDIDPRVGGAFVFVDRRAGVDVEHTGTYLEIDRPRRLKFAFAVPTYSPDRTEVSVDIVPADTGCTLTLTHEQVPPDNAERTRNGWATILDALSATLGVEPGR